MTKFFFKSKKTPTFRSFPKFLGQKVFPKNHTVKHYFIRVSGTMPECREI